MNDVVPKIKQKLLLLAKATTHVGARKMIISIQ